NAANLPAVAVSAESAREERRQALQALAAGEIRIVFSVDLFNEGIDVPSVDTLLLLRPTDSPTVFLQQLGRGLRREPGKSVCTVLDFVGQHRKEFRMHRRYAALLGGGRKQIERTIEEGFPFLPSGCYMQLDAVASQHVLENIRQSLPNTWPARAQELRRVAEADPTVTLKNFLNQTGIELEDVYANNRSWSDLLETGGVGTLPGGPHETPLRRALGRLLHIDDALRIEHYRPFSEAPPAPDVGALDIRTRRLFHMLATVLTEAVLQSDETLQEAADLIWAHPQVLAELHQLLDVLSDRVQHVQQPLSTHPDVPLCIHARYTRRETLAAFASGTNHKVPEWREGVRWLPEARVDLLAFTLDKTSGHFSPTTRYRDYAISPTLLHWESQTGPREASETGKRYQAHEANGSVVLPFARLTTDDRAFWLLGPATYVSHESERPMDITWRLSNGLPRDLFARF